jgi:tetratricopeptide (TPR) repeat protein
VNEEIRVFKSLGRESRIFCLVVDGEPATGECFPPALRYALQDGVVSEQPAGEPLAADVRPGADDRASARLKIVAGLLGVPLDRLRQRDLARRQRRLVWIAATSAIGAAVFGALAVVALRARTEADRQRVVAERQALTARRTADFMKSLFAVADPSEARGNSITAREVLDRGARQIDTQLKDAPIVRADLTTTLGEVYGGLGLFNESLRLLENSTKTPGMPGELSARTLVAIGELQYQRGDYGAALAALVRAMPMLGRPDTEDSTVRMRALATYADVYYAKDDNARAREFFGRLLDLTLHTAGADPTMRARALEGIAQTDLADSHYDAAFEGFNRALEAQIAATGELHPRAAEIVNQLGAVEYFRGRLAAARPYFVRCLDIERRLYGLNHPTTTAALNNLARLMLEQRDFAAADGLLKSSIEMAEGQVSETADWMTFHFTNLALARVGLGDLAGAEPLFHKGLEAAIRNKHRLHGPILTDLADLECRTGRYQDGLRRLDEAQPIVAARYPDEPWRSAHVDNVRAGCLTGLRRYDDARRLVESSVPVLLKRWPATTMYGHDTLQRAIKLHRATGDSAALARYSAMLK